MLFEDTEIHSGICCSCVTLEFDGRTQNNRWFVIRFYHGTNTICCYWKWYCCKLEYLVLFIASG